MSTYESDQPVEEPVPPQKEQLPTRFMQRFFRRMFIGGLICIPCIFGGFLLLWCWQAPLAYAIVFPFFLAASPVVMLMEFVFTLFGVVSEDNKIVFYAILVPLCLVYFSVLFALFCEIVCIIPRLLLKLPSRLLPRFIIEMIAGGIVYALCALLYLLIVIWTGADGMEIMLVALPLMVIFGIINFPVFLLLGSVFYLWGIEESNTSLSIMMAVSFVWSSFLFALCCESIRYFIQRRKIKRGADLKI